jgi:hypothetical protein
METQPRESLYRVEEPYGNDWAIVCQGTLIECLTYMKDDNKGRRRRIPHRLLDPDGKVIERKASA